MKAESPAITALITRTAKVTANVAGKTVEVTVNLNPRTGLTLAGPTTPVSAGVPATFTVGVAATANIRDVTIDFGDGESQSLGAISASTTIQHTYSRRALTRSEPPPRKPAVSPNRSSTSITILPGQPPAVTITASNNNPSSRRNRHLHRHGIGRDLDDPAL